MKRFLSVLLTLALLASLVSVSAVAEERELLTIDVYDDAANLNGLQTGWFAKLIKDKFNIELNIIASQVIGNTIYATRSQEGNLGDILVVDKSKFPEIVEAGLAKDISDKLPECENIMKFKTQIDVFNKGLTGEDGRRDLFQPHAALGSVQGNRRAEAGNPGRPAGGPGENS